MIRLSWIALGPMRQRTCITLHHAVQLHIRRRMQSSAAWARSCIVYMYVRTYPRYTWIARDYGYHVDDWIKCISHARIGHTRRAHILYHPDPGSAVQQNTLGWDRETRAWSRDLYGRSNRIRAIVSQGHGCKVCIYFVTPRHYRFRESLLAGLLNRVCTSVDKRSSIALWVTVFFSKKFSTCTICI